MRPTIDAPAAAIASVTGRWLTIHTFNIRPSSRGRRRPTKSKKIHHNPKPTKSAQSPVASVKGSFATADKPATTPVTTSPSTMIVNRSNRSTIDSVGPGADDFAAPGLPADDRREGDPADDEPGPGHEARIRGQEHADHDDDQRDDHRRQVTGRRLHELGSVTTPDRIPEPGQDEEKRRIDGCKRGSAGSGCVRREDGEQRKDRHLEEHERPRPAILATVELVIQRPVEPGQPDEGEHDAEFDRRAERDVGRQVSSGLGDDDDVDEVVKELEEADRSLGSISPWARGGRQNQLRNRSTASRMPR